MKSAVRLILFVSFALLIVIPSSHAVSINFDELDDGTPVTDQYSALGVMFVNTTAITAGMSLNEFEFPPFSESNVVFDDGWLMTMTFSMPVVGVSAYFTYATPLSFTFYNSIGDLIGSTNSLFSSNLAMSGDPGSSPNELLSFTSIENISMMSIEGDSSGDSFVMDNLMISSVPEPSMLLLLVTGFVAAAARKMTA
jgi:hypothetical protein